MATQANPISGQIEQARKSGYSDQEITSYLSQKHADLAPKIKQATDAGYQPAEVLNYLGQQKPAQQQENTSLPPGIAAIAQQTEGMPNQASDSNVLERSKGAVKGAGRSAVNLSNVVGLGIPKTVAPGLYKNAEAATTPSNETQQQGAEIENTAELFAPIPGVSKIKAAVTAGKGVKALYASARGATDLAVRSGAATGDVKDAAKGGAAGAILGPVMEKLSEVLGTAIPPKIKNKLSQIEKDAMTELEKRGINLSLGQKTGNKVAQVAEQKMQYIPGSSGKAQEFFNTQKEQGAKAFGEMPDKAASYKPATATQGGPTATRVKTDKTDAGEEVLNRGKERIRDLKSYADKKYGSIRSQLDYHQKVVQPQQYKSAQQKYENEFSEYVKQSQIRSKAIVANDGKPITAEQIAADPSLKQAMKAEPPTSPTKPEFSAEVPAPAIRSQLKPLYDEISRSLPETQRASSPGYAVLKKIVEGKEEKYDVLTLDRDLGTLKSFLRVNHGSYLKDSSQRYAAHTINALESGVERALNEVDPSLIGTLKRGRQASKEMHRTNELISGLTGPDKSPMKLFNKLTNSGGVQLPQVQSIKRIAPQAMRTVAQTYLEGLATTATQEGGLTRTAGVLKKWQDLDPRIKKEMFDPQVVKGIDNFLLGAKKIGLDTNPSGTGKWKEIAHYGSIGSALFSLLTGAVTGHAEAGAMATGVIAAQSAGARAISHLMFDPEGIKLLTEVVNSPVGSGRQKAALKALEVISRGATRPETQPPPDRQKGTSQTAVPPKTEVKESQ